MTAGRHTFKGGSQLHKAVSSNTMKYTKSVGWAVHETGFKPNWSATSGEYIKAQCTPNSQSRHQPTGFGYQLRRLVCRTGFHADTIHGESRSIENGRRTQKINHRYLCVIIALFSLSASSVALASPTPFIDGIFETASSDDDPDLIIVREKFNPLSRIQSIYVRFNDGTMDREILSGTLTIVGADITSVLLDRQSIKESDLTWGIPGVDYGLDRGLEGDVPALTNPNVGSDDDLLIVTGHQVRFWLSTTSDIDDFRILVQYPEEHQAAHLGLTFWHLRGRDVEGYPVTTPGSNGQTGGIVVGSLNDHTPDDGDFGEILSIGEIRLKTEDFDIQEDELHLGSVDHQGGVLGPASFTIDNFLNGIDYDEDNQLDQNGQLNPVPNQGTLEQLTVLTTPLRNENDDTIPVDQIQVLGVPLSVDERSIQETLVSVIVSPNTPTGNYRGFLTVWEDNDSSGTIDIGEPVDNIILSLEVAQSERPDLSVTVDDMNVLADADIGLDGSITDASILDDGAIETEVGEVGFDMEQGPVTTSDAEIDLDLSGLGGASDVDTAAQSEQFMPMSDVLTDKRDISDTSITIEMDMGGRAAETWAGTPNGGGLQCNQGTSSDFWYITLLMCMIMGRRRC